MGGNLRIIDGIYEGTKNAIRMTDNASNVLIEDGNYIAENPIQGYGNGKITLNNGIFNGTSGCVSLSNDCELEVNGGTYTSQENSAIASWGNSSVKINKGLFSSNRTNLWDGVIQNGGSGTLTIGNLGDNNEKIIINNTNNKKICGIYLSYEGSTTIINSGTINGYCGINVEQDNSKVYLNGGILTGTGGTVETSSGWSCNIRWGNSNNKIYLKKNTNINLSGRGLTGKNSIGPERDKYVVEVN